MSKTLIALLFILASLLGTLGELNGWLLPTLSWPFTVSREMPILQADESLSPFLAVEGKVHWFGWLCMGVLMCCGLYLLVRRSSSLRLPPKYAKRVERFKKIKRGYWSLITFGVILLLAAMDQCLVGKRALLVVHDGNWYSPALTRAVLPGNTFGLTGAEAQAEADYRVLKERSGQPGWPQLVIMPLVPYDPTMDAAPFPSEQLEWNDGVLCDTDGSPYNGLACRLYKDGQMHLRQRYRKGVPDGHVQGWLRNRTEVYSATYRAGELVEEHYRGPKQAADFLALTKAGTECKVYYHPAPPFTGGHLLGTNSQGADILAYLYGGLQVNIKAALLYLPVIYFIGLTMGMLMGYFGGRFDLITQRIIEIISQLPFLFVVMIVADFVPLEMRGLFLILSLLAMFGWMHMTYLVRTATMKEKTRDYVAAAKVMGAGTVHILWQHILPNLRGIVVTLVPFSVAGVILSLASLDYLGFGLPDTYASWGRLLNDGLSKLSSPWVVSSAFFALVGTLLVVTFIGESIREACDPRRHSYYE
ncbi:MAG: ABC transporter permease subunit [Akkermansia sp.]|nr:ABC transporter permease subunit [Akkermansia sp.]